MSVSKKDRDAAMRIILEHNRENVRGHMIGSVYIDPPRIAGQRSGVRRSRGAPLNGFCGIQKKTRTEKFTSIPHG